MADKYVPRLKEQYFATVRDELQKQFGYKNVNQIPKIEKIVVNMGVGEAATDAKAHRRRRGRPARHHRPAAADHPRPQVHRHLPPARWHADRRQGHPARRPHVGVLRSPHLHRHPAHPRLPAASPRRASTAVATSPWGVTEQLIFPEIDFDKVDHTRGMDITIVTTAQTDEEGKALLSAFHFPFQG